MTRQLLCHPPTALLALLLFFLPIGGCARTDSDPVQSEPGTNELRLVVISPALAVILTDLGLESSIVGRHGWDQVLDPAIPVCGDQSGLDYEALLRARPTHVFTEWGARELPAKLVALAADEEWVVRDFRVLSLADIAGAAEEIEGLLPSAAPTETLARFSRLIERPPPEPIWRGRVVLLMGTSPIAAIGPGSAHHELLIRAGGLPAIEEGSPYMPMHAEDLLRLAPEAIFLLQPRNKPEPETPDTDHPIGTLADLAIPAVEHGRIEVITDPLALLPSTRLVEVAEQMERALQRWVEE